MDEVIEIFLGGFHPGIVAFFLGAAGFVQLLNLVGRSQKRPETAYKFVAYFAFFATYGLYAVGVLPLDYLQALGRVELVAIALAELVYHADAVEEFGRRIVMRIRRWKK